MVPVKHSVSSSKLLCERESDIVDTCAIEVPEVAPEWYKYAALKTLHLWVRSERCLDYSARIAGISYKSFPLG